MANVKELTRRAAEIRKLDGQAGKIAEEIEESRSTLLSRLAALKEIPPPEELFTRSNPSYGLRRLSGPRRT